MKTSLISLETHDDVASIRDKITWQNVKQVILVWPKRGRLVQNSVELALILRTAQSLGVSMAIVSHHPAIREWAQEVGLACFASVPAAERDGWQLQPDNKVSRKTPTSLSVVLQRKAGTNPQKGTTSSVKKRALAGILAAGSLLALLFFLIPGAVVTCYPQTTLQQINVTLKASPVYSGFSPSGNVPGSMIYTEVSGDLEALSSGMTILPEGKAAGEVLIRNLGLQAVDLPAGTVLQTIDARAAFVLTDSVSVPDGIGQTTTGRVEAMQAGIAGNLPAEETLFVQGASGLLVHATSVNAFSGGTEINVASPVDEDYQALKKILLENLKEKALQNAATELSAGTVLIPQTLELDQVLLEDQANPVGAPADTALLRMNVRYQAMTYQQSDLLSIAEVGLNASLPPDMLVDPESIRIESLEDLKVDEFGQATWTMQASRSLIPKWNALDATNRLAGKRIDDARRIISNFFVQRKAAEIRVNISNWPWMPFMPFRIELISAGGE